METNFLTNKLGPLPMWVWIAASVVILYMWSKRNGASSTANVGTAGIAGTSAANLPDGTALDPQSLTVVNEGYNPPAITVNNNGRDTSGYQKYYRDSSTKAIYGIDNQGNRTWLSWDQYVALGKPAYQSFPSALTNPSPIDRPVPVATPSNGAASYHDIVPSRHNARVVTVGSDGWNSSLAGIANHYYNDASQYASLAKANGIANPALITPGQKILVP